MASSQRTASRASFHADSPETRNSNSNSNGNRNGNSSNANSSRNINNYNASNAALLGASKAFGKPVVTPKPSNATLYTTTTLSDIKANGALSAANAAGQRSLSRSRTADRSQSRSPEHVIPAGMKSNGRRQLGSPAPSLKPPAPSPNPPAPSARSTAALSAASELSAATKAAPRPAAPPKPRRLSAHHSPIHQPPSNANPPVHTPPDDLSALPTTSLVDLFERKSAPPAPGRKRLEPIVIRPSSQLAVKSPKPIRVSDGLGSALQAGVDSSRPAQAAQYEGSRQEALTPVLEAPGQGRRGKASPAARRASNNAGADTNGSIRTGAGFGSAQVIDDDELSSPEDAYFSAPEDTVPAPGPPLTVHRPDSVVRTNLAPPTPPAVRRPRHSPSPLRNTQNSTSTPMDITQKSTAPIDIKPLSKSATAPVENFPHSSHSFKSIAAAYNELHPRRMTPLTTGDDLANAMVASSLASMRVGSPRKPEPPPIPTPRRQHHLPFHSRTPSPSKNHMRHTLRAHSSASSGSEESTSLHPYGKHKKKRHLRPKHPNKHHEGARKRWREAVTEAERKRYEGVWAANKGLHCSFTTSEVQGFLDAPHSSHTRAVREAMHEQVSNIVARDLWSRSRLPEQELEAIWDLVDSSGTGRLDKEEFVVGLWLIDQRLKGRKLPQKVSPTVWASVRGLQGIRIKKFVER